MIDLHDADMTVVIANGRVAMTVIVDRATAEHLRAELHDRLSSHGGRV